MARITMRKFQEANLPEIFTLYLASVAAKGVKDKTLKTYEQHFNAISKRLDVDGNISLISSKDLPSLRIPTHKEIFDSRESLMLVIGVLSQQSHRQFVIQRVEVFR